MPILTKRAADLAPETIIDLEQADASILALLNDLDRKAIQYEYQIVESVGGGWLDPAVPEGFVVIYFEDGLSEPLMVPADAEIPLAGEG